MPLALFEVLCVAIIAITLLLAARRRPAREVLADYGALAIAGWIGEETCILLHRFYAYAQGWHGRLDEVPVLVPLIWPLVILSAREVVTALWPNAGRWRSLLVGAVVIADASMVEVLAVRAGLWTWAEAGHLGVPLIGILGWGFFATAADACLGLGSRRSALGARHLLVVALAPLATHALLVMSWWGVLRWVLRGELGWASVAGAAALGALATMEALRARRAGRAMRLEVAGPRMIAASLFFALFATTALDEAPLWIHVAAVAVPYLAATDLSRRAPQLAAR